MGETTSSPKSTESSAAAPTAAVPVFMTTMDHIMNDQLDGQSKQFIDKWTTAGLSKYVALPMICVLGETSSGKSSVLSSLLGLELPAGSTLTTKCPVLIQLTRGRDEDEDEQATIDIHWHSSSITGQTPNNKTGHNYHHHSPRQRKRTIEKHVEGIMKNASPNGESHVDEMKDDREVLPSIDPISTTAPVPSSSSPLQPPPAWLPRQVTSQLQSKVPKILIEAQHKILTYRDTEIAPDVICLTIQSPSTERELTLVDLPGLVAYQHTSDSSLLSQVEQVVLNYVNNPRSILLCILAAPTNIHNSKVLQWCKSVDPTTKRTIPVLTKPDLVDPGSESDVLGLLQESQFHHGFYMVKNRGQAVLDSGLSIEEALEEEMDFFNNTMPWNATAEPRLGITNVRNTLANVLWKSMQSSLPDILCEIKDRLQTAEAAVEEWGTVHHTRSEQRKFYHSLTQGLVANVTCSLSGKGSRDRKISRSRDGIISQKQLAGAARLHTACNHFLKEIKNGSLATIGTLVEGAAVLVSTSGSADDIRGELVHIDRQVGFACVDYFDDKDHTTDVLFDGIGYSTDQPDFAKDEVWSDGSRIYVGRETGEFDSLRKLPIGQIRTDPSWLVEKIAEFRTDDLACFINVDMFQHVVAEFVHDDWAPPCQDLLTALETILTESLNQALQDSFNHELKRYPLLRAMMEKKCHEVSNRLLQVARQDVKSHLEMEENHPYTQDESLMQGINDSRFHNLRSDLEIQLRLTQEGVVFDTEAIKTILDRVFNKHKKLHWMAEQMELVLNCYGKVATQRVSDGPPQICWQTCRRLSAALLEELGSVTDDILEGCLWESPESKKQYQELVTTLRDLQQAMEVVKSF